MAPSESGITVTVDTQPSPAPLAAREKTRRKAIGIGGKAYFRSMRLLYRAHHPFSGKLKCVDHITIPCDDLRVAEEFYVGLLGARIVLRVDTAKLQRMGWSAAQVERERAAHLSVTFGGGPRVELFESSDLYAEGSPHPHLALSVAPGRLLEWKHRLTEHGVHVAGPCQMGPPGQASCYFTDPFGNQLELATIGFTAQELPIGPHERTNLRPALNVTERDRRLD
jgi:catechol 2,3-dioxygenase-like lactoylglutathione lyase family enzyme